MTPFLNFQKIADEFAQRFNLTVEQRDAVELVLDVLNPYLYYFYADQSTKSFTLVSRLDMKTLHIFLSNIKVDMETKEYYQVPKPGIINRIGKALWHQTEDTENDGNNP